MNIALVGFGLAGRVFHAPLISSTDGLNLKLIISSQTKLIQDLYPSVNVSSDFEDALGENVDTIIIATPNELHFEQAQKAILAGKNVVVDKPIAKTSEEIEQLISLSEIHGTFLSVFHNRRYDGDFLTIKKIIESQKLGKIRMFESNFNRFRPIVDKSNWRETTPYAGGILFDLGPHLIDQAFHLFGKPMRVLCDVKKQRVNAVNDDYFHIIFDYENLIVHLNASALTENVRERFVLQGEEGSFSKFGMDIQESQLKAGMSPLIKDFGIDSTANFGSLGKEDLSERVATENGNYLKYYEDICAGKAPVSAFDALAVSQLIEKCLESSEKEKWIKI